jgi:N-acetylglucosamine-6-phosphate deacetylase
MTPIAIVNGNVVLPDRLVSDGIVCCDGPVITYVGDRQSIPDTFQIVDATGGFIAPGFIDMHVHGGAGADFMDGTLEADHHCLRGTSPTRNDDDFSDDDNGQ